MKSTLFFILFTAFAFLGMSQDSLNVEAAKSKKKVKKNEITYSYTGLLDGLYNPGLGHYLYPKLLMINYSRTLWNNQFMKFYPEIGLGYRSDYNMLLNVFAGGEIGNNWVRWNLTVGSQMVLFSDPKEFSNGGYARFSDFEKAKFKTVQPDLTALTGVSFKIINSIIIKGQVGISYGRHAYSYPDPQLRYTFRICGGFTF